MIIIIIIFIDKIYFFIETYKYSLNQLKIKWGITMNLKIVGIFVCIMILTTIPVAAGMKFKTAQREESTALFGKTIIRGLALFPRITKTGNIILFAIRLSFKTFSIEGLTRGVIKLQQLEIPKNFNGYFGRFYIYGTFIGTLNL